MNTDRRQITISGLTVQIVRKPIKNLHLGVYPPDGRVRVAAPLRVSDDAVRRAVISRLGWVKRQRARFAGQERQPAREMVSGESHYFLGRRYRLRVVRDDGAVKITLRGRTMELRIGADADVTVRLEALHRWYRRHLRELAAPLLEKWQGKMGVSLADWRIKRMKTRWGSCNAQARRVWLNLELAKKPVRCLDYLIVHELAHLIERHHDERFIALMDEHLPQWRLHRQELNAAPLAHEAWKY
jgi:predicted metal-dependent hydrolase